MISRTTDGIEAVRLLFVGVTAAADIYTLSLHDALPISLTDAFVERAELLLVVRVVEAEHRHEVLDGREDRKSTRLNSSHSQISYAVFCLKKKIVYVKGERIVLTEHSVLAV